MPFMLKEVYHVPESVVAHYDDRYVSRQKNTLQPRGKEGVKMVQELWTIVCYIKVNVYKYWIRVRTGFTAGILRRLSVTL
jgi:hypothetical protein